MLITALVFATAIHGAVPARSILVFSKTAGFRHDSIPVGRAAIVEMGVARGWTVTCSEDASEIDSAKLKSFDAVVFLSTTGTILDGKQEKALIGFIHGGGGFVGVHAAADCEYKWPWYGKLVGAYFEQHPAQQDAVVKIEDTTHPSTKDLPNPWRRRDEWYDYRTNPRSSVRVLACLDPTSYTGSKMLHDHPIVWCQEFEGGRSWYTGMGHTQESYKDPAYLKMLEEGIEWACGKSKRGDR
ncbi:MAG: ThuA domain-containing protein [Fimbriimonas sp.]|nr:ThuA domain-containing protein [Fimbriimonas sp.]